MRASMKMSRSMARHGECLRREFGPGQFSSSSVVFEAEPVTLFLRRFEAVFEEEALIVELSKKR